MDVHYDDEVLAHYGRKGMRWKIRRNNPPIEVSDVVRSNRQSPALKARAQKDSIVPKAKVQQDSIVASARRAGKSRMAVQRDKILANKRSEKILANLERLRKKA